MSFWLNLEPWRTETFKVSNDPKFEKKLVDVVGLHLQAGEDFAGADVHRTQPSLPMKPGRAGTMTT